MSNLAERGGGVVIRVGGNTQEFAALVPSLPNGKTFSKARSSVNTTVSLLPIECTKSPFSPFSQTQTPAVLYTMDMFYMLSNVSSLVDVKWFLGTFMSLHLNYPLVTFPFI
jgi:hypothetical protein